MRHVLLLAACLLTASCADRGDSGVPQRSFEPSPDGSASETTAPLRHPLKTWMRANAAPAMTAGDAKALSRAFQRIESFSPPGYPDWPSLARAGAAAARDGNLERCRAACKTCHDAHAGRYRRELRSASLPSAS